MNRMTPDRLMLKKSIIRGFRDGRARRPPRTELTDMEPDNGRPCAPSEENTTIIPTLPAAALISFQSLFINDAARLFRHHKRV